MPTLQHQPRSHLPQHQPTPTNLVTKGGQPTILNTPQTPRPRSGHYSPPALGGRFSCEGVVWREILLEVVWWREVLGLVVARIGRWFRSVGVFRVSL